jgi:hypothetical protein
MATDQEALAQLARLLGDMSLRSASSETAREQVERGFERLVDGLLTEAVASDDVINHHSALAFISDRLQFFGPLLSDDQRTRLKEALMEKIEAW